MRLIPSDPDVLTVIGRIKDGSLELQPQFQRGEVWSRAKQRLLIDSILRSWYVPPIHVIRTDDETQEVLDGQQRLRAITDFVFGRFTVDGDADPKSTDITRLDGLHYDTLPPQARRRFDRFTLRIFELVDYEPEEPYELFFRLNQPTTLTSAEKRNAFFGPARDQVRTLTLAAQNAGMTPERVGFSNARMAYEDIVARFVWTLEMASLREKLTANKITERYRSQSGFDTATLRWAEDTLTEFFAFSALDAVDVRLNKATTHSWLCFVARCQSISGTHLADATDAFVAQVEIARTQWRNTRTSQEKLRGKYSSLIPVLNDRATARVNDISSVLLRDAILWALFAYEGLAPNMAAVLEMTQYLNGDASPNEVEAQLLRGIEATHWGSLL